LRRRESTLQVTMSASYSNSHRSAISCHLGQLAVWDTVGELGWSSGLGNHEIQVVIDKLLSKDGEWYRKKKKKSMEEGLDEMDGDDDEPVRQLPKPVPEYDDCLVSV
jgi:hypothetical protein